MSQYDETLIVSPRKAQSALPWILTVITSSLLCGIVSFGAGLYAGQQNLIAFGATTGATADAVADQPTEPPTVAVTVESTTPPPAEETSPTDTATPTAPEITAISFALDITEDMEPIAPNDTFEVGLTEIYVVFDYTGLAPGATWERVWFLDDAEILRSSETWNADASGTFNYVLDANGDVLPAGDWALELYFDEVLLAEGSFTIETGDGEPPADDVETPDETAPGEEEAGVTPTLAPEPDVSPTSTRLLIPTIVLPPTHTPTPTPTVTAEPSPAASSGGGGGVYQLAYSRWDGLFHHLYIGNTSGTTERFIISRAAGPSWSPDGRQLFFFGEQGINQQFRDNRLVCDLRTISGGVAAMDIPASGEICDVATGEWLCERKQIDVQSPPSDVCEENGIRVFQNLDWKEGTARWASVAPGGDAVAFDGRPGGDTYRIYFRAIYNNQQFRFELLGEHGSWSPNGQQLVYRSGRDNKSGIWISNRDDTGHTNISISGTDAFPAWSPNGRLIAFSREESGNVDIYTMGADGSNVQRLTTANGIDTLPVWAPDGSIIFRSTRTGTWSIWKMDSFGNNQVEIIPNAGVGDDWSFSRMDVLGN